jgi:hypothetical protein
MSTYILKHWKIKTNSSQKPELEWELESGSVLSLEANPRKRKWSEWLNVIRNNSNGNAEQGQGSRGQRNIFLFILGLSNDSTSSLERIALNIRMSSE